MTSETYYPEQRHQLVSTLIRRSRFLPDEALDARVEVNAGSRVSLTDVIARGALPAPFTVMDAAAFFDVPPESVEQYLVTSVGSLLGEGQLIAQKGRKRLSSPVVARLQGVESGQIVLQQIPENVELNAGLNGTVVDVRRGRGQPVGAVIETMGALLQGVWGNGKRAIGTLRMEPDVGLENIYSDSIDMQYRGTIVITKRALRPISIEVMAEQAFAGIIAPSMEMDTLEFATQTRGAIMLTEGFGSARMNPVVAQFLSEMDGRQATLDALHLREAMESARRPEVIITVPISTGERPSAPLTNVGLQAGMNVRVSRGDGSTASGTVLNLPKSPIMLDNGLRVPCAMIEFVTGERIAVPLANIDISGR
jgi:hypothetical protein